ncbi:hypothetical protein CEK28_08590 [Xenophilus sp. AP218F]|nr:hypothetical protein CEK28_08590 [Xenophilus sp. AP218F]
MQTNNPEFMEFIQQLQAWHADRVEQLKLITEHKDASIMLNQDEIAGDSPIAKGLRIGIQIALDKLGKLPFSVSPCQIETECDEDEA